VKHFNDETTINKNIRRERGKNRTKKRKEKAKVKKK
jgi:hypothetical protein